MSKYSKWEADHLDLPHPSQSQSASFLTDQLLRKHGFFIVSRPHRAEPWWGRNGNVYSESEALYVARREKP